MKIAISECSSVVSILHLIGCHASLTFFLRGLTDEWPGLRASSLLDCSAHNRLVPLLNGLTNQTLSDPSNARHFCRGHKPDIQKKIQSSQESKSYHTVYLYSITIHIFNRDWRERRHAAPQPNQYDGALACEPFRPLWK